ncbi:hypothetical protein CVT24_012144 [Panaeolus cyanescens]|uniref:DUF6533 domain-containing protein n=1 Tax=Panaeolus cyanescens TaxID=181874 RepID=A0A409X161_9AGAR|nr:hypothetical protein CVT24_012144 [Panaeolus cyanescens]
MNAPPPPDPDALASAVEHLFAGKYFQLAAFVMLVYDHALTFSEEVERVWKQRFSGATLLFLLNRYITPIQFIIIIQAFHDPIWTKEACDRFVAFEGASTVALIAAVGLRTGFAVPLPDFLVGCIFTGESPLFPSLWVSPLILDSIIFALTLWRTRMYIRDSGKTPTIHVFVRDGALYFAVIFLANLMNTLIFFLSPTDLKAVGATFSQLITSVMVSRLVLNLRSTDPSERDATGLSSYSSGFQARRRDESFMTRTLGNLGEDFINDENSNGWESTSRRTVQRFTERVADSTDTGVPGVEKDDQADIALDTWNVSVGGARSSGVPTAA